MSIFFDRDACIERITTLSSDKNISVNKALLECGFKDFISNLRKGSIPSVDKFLIIADYFNVDVGWLLTGNKSSAIKLDELENTLLEQFNQLDRDDKLRVVDFLTMFTMMQLSKKEMSPTCQNTNEEKSSSALKVSGS